LLADEIEYIEDLFVMVFLLSQKKTLRNNFQNFADIVC